MLLVYPESWQQRQAQQAQAEREEQLQAPLEQRHAALRQRQRCSPQPAGGTLADDAARQRDGG